MKIPITLQWTYLQGDKTEFQQRSIELKPIDVAIVVELEENPKYFFNKEIRKYWADKIVADLSDGKMPSRIPTPLPILLTPEGAAEVRRVVNETLKDTHSHTENNQDDDYDHSWDENDVIK